MRACSRCRPSREGTRGGARLRRPTGAYAGAVSTAHGPELGRDQPGGPAGSPGRPADPATGQAGPAADVGRWFSTAAAPPGPRPGPGARVALQVPAWGPVESASYGAQSPPEQLEAALDLLRGRPTAVLTGAGMSTGSGLPDYRGRDAVPRFPMTYQEFMGSDLS